jgi:ubiquinone/menaquinone biosynthesis C-methylase UbiE
MNSNKDRIKAKFADVEAYERSIRRFVPYYEEMMDSVLDCLPKSNKKYSILELGCGTGNLILRLLEKASSAQLVAIDIVEEMIKACRNRLEGRKVDAEFICAEMTEFCRPNAFDYVFSTLVLHYPETEKKNF